MASRLNASYVSIFQRFCDVVAIYWSLYIVFKINHLPINNQTLLALLSIVSIFQLIGGLTDFYRSWRGISLLNELISCFKNISLSIIIFYLITLFFTNISLIVVLDLFVCLVLFMGTLRIGVRLTYSLFFRLFDKSKNVIVIGDSVKAKKLFSDLNTSKWTGYNPIGLFSFKNNYNRLDFQGDIDDVVKKVKSNSIGKVYIVIDKYNLKEVESLLEMLADSTCSTIIIPDLFNFNFLYSRVEDINGTPVIPLFDTRINGINNFLKRSADICFASIILLLISPLLVFISIAIKLNSTGPVFFKQIRYGLNGKSILVYKFRTMSVMENGTEVKQAVKNDPRVTSVGRILRKTSLDELPQFFNVIIGNMSVVGPRPHAVAHNEEYRKLITGYMLRHKVKPGITGLAQIKGWRGETDTLDKMEKRIECDLEYIRTWSILLDIKIIFLTIFHGFINKAAY
ncbi:undecaprenyl-phosphate glucose phosphotransferase [Acinetobacter terrae]|uniref:Undecaprenyl-phosphate glucose phosphotransferase n=1 Tax=Acinetobacter terrae TaxID=2731247 RepID=A0ABX1UZ23_9GAMM|nr:undecaprenyl-phosphate glucose phosphotransferase [Acinetobacter terrae]NNH86653.1 undecaprenyl-phosphate glucose phosphotransferase [Acinetobacter terrae]